MAQRTRKIIAPEASPALRSVTIEENKEVKADIMTPEHRRALASHERRAQLVSLADQVAGETMHFKNHKFPNADQIYPDVVDARMRFVSRYYPYSKPSGLYVDEPKTHREMIKCYEKQKEMKKMKLRYIIIEPSYQTPEGTNVPGSTLSDLYDQLGE